MRNAIASFAIAMLAVAGLASAQDRPGEAEERIAVPRSADGSVDTQALTAEIQSRFAAGATEIRVDALRQEDAQSLLLDPNSNVLAEIGALLPNDGVERHVRLRGAFDARVQRNEEGELRARIEQIDLGNLTAAQRAELAHELAAAGNLDRLRIRGTDANGERVRVEFRDDRGIVRNEGRGDRREAREERLTRADDNRGRGRADRPERMERAQRVERPERAQRPDRSGRH